MSPEKFSSLVSEIESSGNSHLRLAKLAREKLAPIAHECCDSTRFDLTCAIVWIHVYAREDIIRLMTLAPIWTKARKSINYHAQVDGFHFTIFAYDNALPPTCRVVKEKKLVPAVEAHEEIVETIVCDVGTTAEAPKSSDVSPENTELVPHEQL